MIKLSINRISNRQKIVTLLSVIPFISVLNPIMAQNQPAILPSIHQMLDKIQQQAMTGNLETTIVSLNGTWNITPEGMTETTLVVPGFYVWKKQPTGTNWYDFGETEGGPWKIFEGSSEATYQRQFDIPSTMSGKRIYLRFESVNFFTEIYVNSQYVGTHIGGYVPFEFDITSRISIPSTANKLEVKIIYDDIRFLNTIDQPIWPTGFFANCWNLGITGDVSLIGRSAVYIDDIYVKTSFRTNKIQTNVRLRNDGTISRNVTLNATIEKNGTLVLSIGNKQVLLNAGDTTTVILEQTWTNPQLWEPASPQLYNLVGKLTENSLEIHKKTVRFGFREIWMQGNQFFINGIRTNLRGDNIVVGSERSYFQYYVPDPISWSDILDSLFALNCNVIRFHQEPTLPWMLDLCDEKGMLVIAESAVYSRENVPFNSSAYLNNGKQWQQEWIKRDRNHPSIIIWSAENEMWYWGGKYTASQAKQFGDLIPLHDTSRPILYEGDFDCQGTANTVSYHYIYGFPNGWPTGSIYQMGSYVNSGKPTSFGEFEWTRQLIPESERVKRQCIKTRAARYLNFADIRPYRLDWAWHPSPEFFTIYDGWMPSQDEITFLANTMNPVAAFDKNYYEYAVYPPIPEYNEWNSVTRRFILFNDARAGTSVEVRWSVLLDNIMKSSGSFTETIPLGDHIEKDVVFNAPIVSEHKIFELEISTWKVGIKKFSERTLFRSLDIGIAPPSRVASISFQRVGNNLTLSWNPITTNTEGRATSIHHYVLYKSSDVTFSPGKTDSVTNITASSYVDNVTGILDNPNVNRFYRVKAVDTIGLQSELSNCAGAFDFALLTQSGTDFNAIALPLVLNGVTDSQQLLSRIPGCNSVAFWDVTNQGYKQYIPGISSKNFPVDMGKPFHVNATLDTFFTLFGETTNPVFYLQTTPTSDFNTIMIPLNKIQITKASQLLSDITHCNSVARWNPVTQAYDQFISGTPSDFNVYVGHAYLVNVTSSVTWPAGSIPKYPPPPASRTDLDTEDSEAPHLVWGIIEQESLNIPLDEIGFIAYCERRPKEILTETSPGCWFRDRYWAVQCASFPSKWSAGDTCVIQFQDIRGNKLGETKTVLTYDASEKASIETFESQQKIPAHIGVNANYPNPFNSETIIPYRLDRRTQVRLSVINIRGEEIRILLDGIREAGHYEIRWDGTDRNGSALPSGMYIVRMQWNDGFQIQKLMLIR